MFFDNCKISGSPIKGFRQGYILEQSSPWTALNHKTPPIKIDFDLIGFTINQSEFVAASKQMESTSSPDRSLADIEKKYILRVLEAEGGNRTRTAKVLGISLRGLRYKLKAYSDNLAPPALK